MKRIASVLLSAAIIGATPFVCETYSDLGTNISVEAASVIDTPKYAYGDGSSSVYKGERLINIRISWSDVRDAEQYNVYLYDFISKKYCKVYEVTEGAWGLSNSVNLSNWNIPEMSNYVNGGKFYFSVSAVKTVGGQKVESELSKC